MGWFGEAQSEDNPFWTSSFKFYIKYNACHVIWLNIQKWSQLTLEKFFKRKAFNDETDPTLNGNYPTEEPVDAESTTEESCANTYKVEEGAFFNPEVIPIKQVEVNEDTGEPVYAEDMTE